VFFAVLAGIYIQFVIFCKLAKDAVPPGQEGGLDLSPNTLFHKSGPDERQVAVRNAAYYRAYRVVVVYLLLIMPVANVCVAGEAAWYKVLSELIVVSFIVLIFTLPQAIILWTEPDMPEEAP